MCLIFATVLISTSAAFASSTCNISSKGLTGYVLDSHSHTVSDDGILNLKLVVKNYLCTESQGEYKWVAHKPLESLPRTAVNGTPYKVHFLKIEALLTNANYKLLTTAVVENTESQSLILQFPVKEFFGNSRSGRVIFFEKFYTMIEMNENTKVQNPFTGGEYVIDLKF